MKTKIRTEIKRKNEPKRDIGVFGYIKESRKYIYTIIWLFVISVIVGFFIIPLSPALSDSINELLKKVMDIASNKKGLELILFIFANNTWVSFLGMAVGLFFGLFSLFNSITNGVVLGYVLSKVYSVSGFSDFWRILPHGIFELPAVFISLGLGLKLGIDPVINFINKCRNKGDLYKIGLFSLFVGLFGIFLLICSLILSSFNAQNMLSNPLSMIFFTLGMFMTSISFIFFFVNSFVIKELRDKQWSRNFVLTVKVFIYLVIPLLIIAAVIEGILISLVG